MGVEEERLGEKYKKQLTVIRFLIVDRPHDHASPTQELWVDLLGYE